MLRFHNDFLSFFFFFQKAMKPFWACRPLLVLWFETPVREVAVHSSEHLWSGCSWDSSKRYRRFMVPHWHPTNPPKPHPPIPSTIDIGLRTTIGSQLHGCMVGQRLNLTPRAIVGHTFMFYGGDGSESLCFLYPRRAGSRCRAWYCITKPREMWFITSHNTLGKKGTGLHLVNGGIQHQPTVFARQPPHSWGRLAKLSDLLDFKLTLKLTWSVKFAWRSVPLLLLWSCEGKVVKEAGTLLFNVISCISQSNTSASNCAEIGLLLFFPHTM